MTDPTNALNQILTLVGNVQHQGGGHNSAKLYADMLNDIRRIAQTGLGQQPSNENNNV